MEIGEAVAVLAKELAADPYCGGKKMTGGGTAVIDGIKGGVGDPAVLREHMLGAHKSEPAKPAKLGAEWDLCDCGTSTFPYQSHHLIPEKQLPGHKVTVWLTDAPKKEHPKYVLSGDTNYDTNAAENGYFMPFACTTHQWNATSSAIRRGRICFEMMRRTRIQLHQGPHSFTDYLEEDDIETAGYKRMVERFLNMIYDRGELHLELPCEICRKQASPKIKVQPLEAIVLQMHRVAGLLKILTDSQRIFVSRRAAGYFKLHNVKGKVQHPAEPFVSPA